MFSAAEIDEWIKEVKARPESAPQIIRFLSERLQELTSRNEELLEENIALHSEKRVEEYERRIAYLEYQLQVLTRYVAGKEPTPEKIPVKKIEKKSDNLVVYNASGQIIRCEVASDWLSRDPVVALQGELKALDEPPRLLAGCEAEELLFLFASGRVKVLPLKNIPHFSKQKNTSLSWESAALPHEPGSGDKLVCLSPVSELLLADYFVQVSRRGRIKKTPTSMAQSMLDKQYIGKGTNEKADQAFELCLCKDGDRMIMVSWEGNCLSFDVTSLSYTVEQRLKLKATDHIVSAFILKQDTSLVFLTQGGKVVHRTVEALLPVKSQSSKGLVLLSENRLKQGARMVAAASVNRSATSLALHANGNITSHKVAELLDTGSLPTKGGLLAWVLVRGR